MRRSPSGDAPHSELELQIREINTGVFAFEGAALLAALDEVKSDNAQGELYLPDVIPVLHHHERSVLAFEVDAREISQPGGGDELESEYVEGEVLDLGGWARDALALALPAQVLCRDDCAGLCPVCGADLNAAGPEHSHQAKPDPRWAKLSELEFDG